MAILNKQFKKHFGALRAPAGDGSEFRLPVLIYGTLSANKRNRFWQSQKTIADDLGTYKPRISDAIDWLIEMKALEIVPKEQRIDEERLTRGHVYQLTGAILLAECEVPYLYLGDPGDTESVPQRVTESVPITPDTPANGTLSVTLWGTDSEARGTDSASVPLYRSDSVSSEKVSDKPAPPSPPVDVTSDEPPATAAAGKAEVFRAYENEIGLPTAMIVDELNDTILEYPADWIIEAIHEAARNNVRKWSYVRAILERWKREGRAARLNGKSNPSPRSATPPPRKQHNYEVETWHDEHGNLDPDGLFDQNGVLRRLPPGEIEKFRWRKPNAQNQTAS